MFMQIFLKMKSNSESRKPSKTLSLGQGVTPTAFSEKRRTVPISDCTYVFFFRSVTARVLVGLGSRWGGGLPLRRLQGGQMAIRGFPHSQEGDVEHAHFPARPHGYLVGTEAVSAPACGALGSLRRAGGGPGNFKEWCSLRVCDL